MKAMPIDSFAEMEEEGSTVAMDVDDAEVLENLVGTDGLIAALDNRLVDPNFFNSFEDDFDDTDIN